MGKQQDRNHAAALGNFTERLLSMADALCDEWPEMPLEGLLTALDSAKNRILIARIAAITADGQGLDIVEDEDGDDDAT